MTPVVTRQESINCKVTQALQIMISMGESALYLNQLRALHFQTEYWHRTAFCIGTLEETVYFTRG